MYRSYCISFGEFIVGPYMVAFLYSHCTKSKPSNFIILIEAYCEVSTILFNLFSVVSNHWTGLLDWNTGMDYWTGIFLFYTFLRVGLLYIWVTCDNISALSGEYDTLILKSYCE